jgi:hypothetical protein
VPAEILIREDTGTHAVVRVIEPDTPVSAPYSRACGLLDKWAKAERRAVDEFAAWIEGQAAQAHAEMRLLCDELGLPVAWAEFSDDSLHPAEQPAAFNPVPAVIAGLRARYGPPPGDGIPVLAEAYQQADGWTPRPEDFAPAPDENMPGRYALAPSPEGTYTQPGAVDTVERRSWSAEWAAFRADVKDMWRDLRQSLTWWRR